MCSSDLVLLPAYLGLLDRVQHPVVLAEVTNLFGGPARIVGAESGGLRLLLIDAPHLYARPGGPYLDPAGNDWPDNHLRFAALSWVAAGIATGTLPLADGWRPDIVHLHDWQAALTAAYLHFHKGPTPPSLLTVQDRKSTRLNSSH